MSTLGDCASIEMAKREVGITGIRSCRFIEAIDAPARYPIAHLLNYAHQFMMRRPWKRKVLGFWCGIFEPGLVGVVLYKIVPTRDDIPAYHWVVVGPDIPHAYITTDDALNPACAIDSYASVMEDWIRAVEGEAPLDDVYPVEVPSGMDNKAYALRLAETLKKIDCTVLEQHRADLGDRRK